MPGLKKLFPNSYNILQSQLDNYKTKEDNSEFFSPRSYRDIKNQIVSFSERSSQGNTTSARDLTKKSISSCFYKIVYNENKSPIPHDLKEKKIPNSRPDPSSYFTKKRLDIINNEIYDKILDQNLKENHEDKFCGFIFSKNLNKNLNRLVNQTKLILPNCKLYNDLIKQN